MSKKLSSMTVAIAVVVQSVICPELVCVIDVEVWYTHARSNVQQQCAAADKAVLRLLAHQKNAKTSCRRSVNSSISMISIVPLTAVIYNNLSKFVTHAPL
jgi:hypothetical protein